jgi:hypothetical protein
LFRGLVGSEMCIRDRNWCNAKRKQPNAAELLCDGNECCGLC